MNRWEEWASCAVIIGAVWFAYLLLRRDLWETWLAVPMFIGACFTFAFCGVLGSQCGAPKRGG